jgi:hypothetical protein
MPADNRVPASGNDRAAWRSGRLIGVRWPPRLEEQAAQGTWALGVWEDEGGALARLYASRTQFTECR